LIFSIFTAFWMGAAGILLPGMLEFGILLGGILPLSLANKPLTSKVLS
jgi:hypothetical protein